MATIVLTGFIEVEIDPYKESPVELRDRLECLLGAAFDGSVLAFTASPKNEDDVNAVEFGRERRRKDRERVRSFRIGTFAAVPPEVTTVEPRRRTGEIRRTKTAERRRS